MLQYWAYINALKQPYACFFQAMILFLWKILVQSFSLLLWYNDLEHMFLIQVFWGCFFGFLCLFGFWWGFWFVCFWFWWWWLVFFFVGVGEILIDVKAQIQLSIMSRQSQRPKSWQDLEKPSGMWEHRCFTKQIMFPLKHIKQAKYIIHDISKLLSITA